MSNKRPLIAHISIFLACAFWGLMAPLGKDAMTHGLTGLDMVSFRYTFLDNIFLHSQRTRTHP